MHDGEIDFDGCVNGIVLIVVFLAVCTVPVEMGWANSGWEWVDTHGFRNIFIT